MPPAVVGGRLSSMLARAERALSGREAPVLLGAITAVLVVLLWGGLNAVGAYHDERAYLVQARLLADFSWTAPTPPLPIFWEMAHMYLEPAIFAKYPPGHALLLAPGAMLGMPGLVPVLLAGVSGAMVFTLARRFTTVWIALGTWALWTTVPETLDWHSSYFSETVTAAFWLVALWALIEWREKARAPHLVLLTAMVGWMGITRPITAMALALPIGVIVLATAWRRRALVGWLSAAAVGIAILSIVPYWSMRTLGSVSPLPYSDYSRHYFPWDMPGFVRDTSPPLRTLPPDLEQLASATKRNYEGHTAARMPANAVARTERIVTGSLGPGAESLWVLIPVGMFAVGAGVALTLGASFVLLVAVYLVMPHTPVWTIYYLEIMPAVCFVAVAGLAKATSLAAGIARDRKWSLFTPQRLAAASAFVLVALIATNAKGIPGRRWHEKLRSARQELARELIAGLPSPRAVVFVRRTTPMNPHFTLWDILGDPERTDTWIVRDLGDRLNLRLVSLADDRVPYILDEGTMTLSAWHPPAMPGTQLIPVDSATSRQP